MPAPTRRYATPASEFGIAKPVESWFDFAASGTPRTGPAFSTALSEAENRNTQRELERLQLQRQLQSEQAAQEFLANAAGQKPKGLMRMLSESPEILTSEAAPAIQDYVAAQQKQQQERQIRRNPFSDKILGPAIANTLPASEQIRVRKMVEEGTDYMDAIEQLETEKIAKKSELERQTAAEAAAEAGVPIERITEALNMPDWSLRLAALRGAATKRPGAVDQVSISDAMSVIKSATDEFGEIVDPARHQLGLDLLDAATKRYLPQAAPQAVGSTASERVAAPFAMATAPNLGAAGQMAGIAGGIVPRMDLQPVAPTAPAPLPGIQAAALSPFEQRMQNQNKAALRWREELNREWTEAKDKPLQSSMQDMGVKPERVVELAQQAMLGKPIDNATPQERDLAIKIGQYALRALEGEPIVIGEEASADMFGVQLPSYRTVSPGYAFLMDRGLNPEEKITIPGASFWGTDKTVTAAELMDLRLKEIAQPMQQAQQAARQQQKRVQTNQESEDAFNELIGGGKTKSGQ